MILVVEPNPSPRTKTPGCWKKKSATRTPSLERRIPSSPVRSLSRGKKLPCDDNTSIPTGRTAKAVGNDMHPKTSERKKKQQTARAPHKIGTAISVARSLERKGPEKLRELYRKTNSCFCCVEIFSAENELLTCQCFSSSSCRGAMFCVQCAKEWGFAGTCDSCESFLCGNCHFLGWVKGRESRLLCDLCCEKKGESLFENMW